MNRNQQMIATLIEQLRYKLLPFSRMEKLNLLRDLAVKEKDEKLIRLSCSTIIEYINTNISKLELDEQIKAHTMLKDAYTCYAPYNFEAYLIAMEWNRPVEKRFYQPRMKVLKPVVNDLQDLGDGKIDTYCLSLPPRVGKTSLGLFFISWMAGKYPDEHIFAAGYASGLVGTFYNGVMDFIDSSEYRFYDIFPELLGNFSKSAENRTIDLWKDDRYKTITFRSIDGQITGALEASSLLYLDDMCSGIEEAMNIDRLDKLWSKVSVDLMQRRVRNPRSGRSAPILAIGTIWSIHDPICRLKERYKDDPRFRERVMPALSVELKSNFDYDYGVGFTTEMYLELKAGMDEVSWECVYQQNPMERDGLLFPNSELKRFTQVPNSPPDMVIAFCDVAFGGDDFLSFPIAAYWGDDGYIIDVVFRKKARYQITEPMVAGKIVSNGVQNAEFESNNGGEFYAKDVDDMVKNGSTHRCNITTSLAGNKKSKLARIIQYQGDIKNLYFRDPSSYKPDSEYGLFMTNLTTFVQTGSSLNDDAPDSLAGLCKLKKIPRVGRVETMPGMRGAM